MKKYGFNILAALLVVNTMGCGNSQQDARTSSEKDTTASETLTSKTDKIQQKITPCLWVETTDAKAVAAYYLAIFKDGKLKEHRTYKNPPEAGGGDFETAIIEIADMELSICGSILQV